MFEGLPFSLLYYRNGVIFTLTRIIHFDLAAICLKHWVPTEHCYIFFTTTSNKRLGPLIRTVILSLQVISFLGDTLLVCANGHLTDNKLAVGLLFPSLLSSGKAKTKLLAQTYLFNNNRNIFNWLKIVFFENWKHKKIQFKWTGSKRFSLLGLQKRLKSPLVIRTN